MQSRAAPVVDDACVDSGPTVGTTVLAAVGAAQEVRKIVPPIPNNFSASLRLRSCPMGSSSFSIPISFLK
jgi:hypothetical protein